MLITIDISLKAIAYKQDVQQGSGSGQQGQAASRHAVAPHSVQDSDPKVLGENALISNHRGTLYVKLQKIKILGQCLAPQSTIMPSADKKFANPRT